ncbi:MAG: 23S rRNA (guanosine(2251)-2'-O)-methyltransferase RlmB [Candidatus Margulisiibacteriota bacterium]
MSDKLEGSNPVLEALKAGRSINKILISRDVGRHSVLGQIINLARQKGVVVESVDRAVLDRESETRRHQGVLAYISAHKYYELEDILEKSDVPLLVLLDGVEDPHNLGAVLRSADVFGVDAVVIQKRRAAQLTPTVARTSAGAIEYVPVCRESSIIATIEKLKKHHVWVAGVEVGSDKQYYEADFKLPTALVLGGEDKGLSEAVRKHCDYTVSIPMKGKINSLNISVAAAIVMCEAARQRG